MLSAMPKGSKYHCSTYIGPKVMILQPLSGTKGTTTYHRPTWTLWDGPQSQPSLSRGPLVWSLICTSLWKESQHDTFCLNTAPPMTAASVSWACHTWGPVPFSTARGIHAQSGCKGGYCHVPGRRGRDELLCADCTRLGRERGLEDGWSRGFSFGALEPVDKAFNTAQFQWATSRSWPTHSG